MQFCPNCTAKLTTTSFGDTAHPTLSTGTWIQNTSTLVLQVAGGQRIAPNSKVTVYLSNSSMLLYPGPKQILRRLDGKSGVYGWLSTVRLNWVTDHPTATKPRLGFLVQMTSDPSWASDVQTMMVPDDMDVPALDTYDIPYGLMADMTLAAKTITISGTISSDRCPF